PWISPDGRYIAFASLASNLVHDDLNEREDIFVRDMELLQTSRVAFGNNKCEFPVLSAGGYVLFRSDATDLVPGDTNGVSDMFLTVR
ncbi:MAG: hypothetical protein FWD57_11675, partial [Polyangiaceae bacterium]|nr:hypothetical protein [Polyangiaceae bacterium]